MTNRQTLELHWASEEMIQALKNLNIKKLHLYGVDYTTVNAANLPMTITELKWLTVNAKMSDLKPLAKSCPDLTQLECYKLTSEAVDDIKLFTKLESLDIKSSPDLPNQKLERLVQLPHLKHFTYGATVLKGADSWNR